MKISPVATQGLRFAVEKDGGEIAHAYLFVMTNDLNASPFGLLEDVHVVEEHRGNGVGSQLVKDVIAKAKEIGCYKLIATSRHSRPKVHALYIELGFDQWGLEFRLNF